MDKTIEFLLRHADVRLIEANHFAKRSRNGWTDPFWANVPVPDGKGSYVYQRLPHDDPRVQRYIAAYFPALQGAFAFQNDRLTEAAAKVGSTSTHNTLPTNRSTK